MKEDKRYDEEIEKTLSSLDDIEHTGPAPFFYTRLTGKLSKRNESIQWSFPLIWRIALIVLLLINGVTVYIISREEVSDPLQTLSADYFDNDEVIYELNYYEE